MPSSLQKQKNKLTTKNATKSIGAADDVKKSKFKKNKSMSEIINAQFDKDNSELFEAETWDNEDGPKIDEYYEDDERVNYNNNNSVGTKKSKYEQQEKKNKNNNNINEPQRLRRRGPLDASLSAGEYSATPVDVEAAMDGIFGALEMNDDEFDNNYNEEEEDDDFGMTPYNESSEEEDENNNNKRNKKSIEKRGVKRARVSGPPETEEEYIAWLEAKQAKKNKINRLRGSLSTNAGTAEEMNILEQLESLRSAQMELIGKQSSDNNNNNNNNEGEEDLQVKQRQRAQAAVKHYVMVYSQLLRVRIKLQPIVGRAVAFPQYYALPDFLQNNNNNNDDNNNINNDADQIKSNTQEVVNSLKDLLDTFYTLATDNKQQQQKQKHNSIDFNEIHTTHRKMMKDVDACIEYWGAKLVQPNSAKLRTIAQPLLTQIHAILESKARLRAKVQKNRSHINIISHPEHIKASQSLEGKAARALHIAAGDVDDEIYEDGEFLREVVRRGGVAKLEQQLEEIQRSLNSHETPTKRGFHRLTKGKAVNYEPRSKLVGFLLPVPYVISGQYEVMVNSLFQ